MASTLWHLPVIVLTGAAIDTGRVDLPRAGLQIVGQHRAGRAVLAVRRAADSTRRPGPALAPASEACDHPRLGLDRPDRGGRCGIYCLRRPG